MGPRPDEGQPESTARLDGSNQGQEPRTMRMPHFGQ
jgi:hypothetical protein